MDLNKAYTFGVSTYVEEIHMLPGSINSLFLVTSWSLVNFLTHNTNQFQPGSKTQSAFLSSREQLLNG